MSMLRGIGPLSWKQHRKSTRKLIEFTTTTKPVQNQRRRFFHYLQTSRSSVTHIHRFCSEANATYHFYERRNCSGERPSWSTRQPVVGDIHCQWNRRREDHKRLEGLSNKRSEYLACSGFHWNRLPVDCLKRCQCIPFLPSLKRELKLITDSHWCLRTFRRSTAQNDGESQSRGYSFNQRCHQKHPNVAFAESGSASYFSWVESSESNWEYDVPWRGELAQRYSSIGSESAEE